MFGEAEAVGFQLIRICLVAKTQRFHFYPSYIIIPNFFTFMLKLSKYLFLSTKSKTRYLEDRHCVTTFFLRHIDSKVQYNNDIHIIYLVTINYIVIKLEYSSLLYDKCHIKLNRYHVKWKHFYKVKFKRNIIN